MAPETHDGQMKTPMGIFTLDFAFGTAPNPGGGLQYVQVGPDHWWDGDMKSPTYNTMQVCEKAQCPFDTDPGQRHREPRDPAVRACGGDGREQGNGYPVTAARSSCTPPTADRRRAAWRSTTAPWSRSCGGCSRAR